MQPRSSTVPRGGHGSVHLPVPNGLSFIRPDLEHTSESPRLPQRHARRERFQTIYFAPQSLSEAAILFGLHETSPDTTGIRELPHRRAEPKGAKNEPRTSQQTLPCPSQEEMDYVVQQLELANYLPADGTEQGSNDSTSDYSGSDRNDSPTLPSPSFIGLYSNPSASTASPSLTTGSSRSSIASLPGASLINHTGTIAEIKRLSACATTSKIRSGPTPGLQHGPDLSLPRLFTSIALTDPKVTGQPIRFTSSTFEPGTNVLKVGGCTYLNLPYGVTSECGIRIEPRPFRKIESKHAERADCRNQQIRLQISQRIVHAGSGRQAMLLSAETDVTDGFTSNVRSELAANVQHSSIDTSTHASEGQKLKLSTEVPPRSAYDSLRGDTLVVADYGHVQKTLSSATYDPKMKCCNISKLRGSPPKEATVRSVAPMPEDADKDIWLNIAKSLATGNASTTTLPPSRRALTRPSPALKDLLSLLDEIKLLHRNLFIIRMKNFSSHPRGSGDSHLNDRYPSLAPDRHANKQDRFSIPWLSAHLFQLLFAVQDDDDDDDDYGESGHTKTSATGSSGQRHFYTTVLRTFKDAMALQLGEHISSSSSSSAAAAAAAAAAPRDANARKTTGGVPRAFFKRINLPLAVSGLRLSAMYDVPFDRARGTTQVGVYAVPMFDDAVGNTLTRCWACFLVGAELEGLWN